MRRVLGVALAWSLLAGCSGLMGGRPAWELPPPAVVDAPVVDAARLHRAELPNGLELVIFEDARLPSISMGVTARRGAGTVGPEQAGLAQYTAELMERGAGDRDALALAGAVDELGASLVVDSGWDSTTTGVSGLSRDLDTLFGVLADVVLRPRFDAGEARKVQADQLAGLEKAKDDPRTLASQQFARALYPEHRYGLPGGGVRETVAKLTTAQARAFHARVFHPGNCIFYATGDLDAQAMIARVREAFGDWASVDETPPGPPPPAQAPTGRKVVIVDRPDLGQAQILIGHEGIHRAEPSRIAVGLMNVVLGSGGFSSRLMSRVRADEGLTYGVSSFFAKRRHPGPFGVSTFTRVPEVRRVVDIVLAELERVREEPPDAEELANAQSQAVGRFAMGLETSMAVTSSLVDLDVHRIPRDALDTYRGRVRALTVEDTTQAARERIHPDRAAIVVVGPAEQIEPLLADLGNVEIVSP